MKNENEKMTNYIENLDNIHVESVEKVTKVLRISLGTLLVIIVVIVAVMSVLIGSIVSVQTQNVFTMNKEQFINMIEKKYGQELEMIEDGSISRKGTGTYIFKTKKEPKIEFGAIKSRIRDTYFLDYEEKAILYYANKKETPLFENIKIEQSEQKHSEYPEFKLTECALTLTISSYDEIEKASEQLYNLTNWLKKKLKALSVSPYLKIGDYTSTVYYLEIKSKEDAIFQEKYQYYWYLKENEKDVSFVPEQDIKEIDYPKTLEVYVNGEKLKDKIDPNLEYVIATYNEKEKCYEIQVNKLIWNCNQFEVEEGKRWTEAFKFKYQGKEYGTHYRDEKLRGNKLPATSKIEYLKQLLHITVEYDYTNQKINFIL